MARIRPKIKKFKVPVPKRYWAYIAICVFLFVFGFAMIFILADFERYSTELPWYAPFVFIFICMSVFLLAVPFGIKGGEIYRKSVVPRKIDYYSRFKYVSIKPEDYDHIWFDYIYSERLLINIKDGKYLVHWQEFDCNDERWIEMYPDGVWCDSWEELKLDWIEKYGFINNDVEDEPTTGEENG